MSILLARFLVFAVCLALPQVSAATSASKLDTLTIFAKNAPEHMDALRDEVARLMESAGFAVEWRNMSERRAGEDFAHLATVDFRGSCAVHLATPPVGSAADMRSLASTAVVDGQVLPFSTVNCDALRRVLGPALTNARRDVRSAVFGRAAARVLAHELFHMLAQTKSHGVDGVSKACFGVADLTADRFGFDPATLAQMRPEQPPQSMEFNPDESGR